MSLLSRIRSFFTNNSTTNADQTPQIGTSYELDEFDASQPENLGTYDMYLEPDARQESPILGTLMGTEEISDVLEAQSRRYEHELI